MLIYARAQCLATRPLPGTSRAPQSDPGRAKPPRSIGALDPVPADFDPAANPILARHFFGVEPFCQIGEVAARVAADLKQQH